MKLSLIIPTRSRAEYLRHSLATALVARDKANYDVEIIVSDNQSEDDTEQVLQPYVAEGVKCLQTPSRYSMRRNFEFALSAATGTHILFIGDDDAVLPNGLRILADLIRDHDPDIVQWRVLNYLWPNSAKGTPGTLRLRPQVLDGRLKKIDPRAVLGGFEGATFRSYYDGGTIYHGCISRRLIDRAVAKSGGPYFRGSAPDVFTSIQALMATDNPILHINLPITLGGASPRSNGVAWQKSATGQGGVAGTEFYKFIAESDQDPFQCKLPASCQSLNLMILDCLQTAATLQEKTLRIDSTAWRKRIAQEIEGFAEPARTASITLARDVLGLDIVLPQVTENSGSVAPVRQAEAGASSTNPVSPRLRHRLTSLSYTGGDEMLNVRNAANLLDRLLDLDGFHGPTDGLLSAMIRILLTHRRASKL